MKNSFYWHDYETFGLDPGKDRAAQFAGIRTDSELNIIDKPLVIYCQPANDFLPQPEACLVTGITPQEALAKGIPEYQFFKLIHQQLATANTCTVGYNNLRFDDEFTRFGLYRNFYDAYAREWQNSNSRWDIIDMLRLTAALRPEGIHWPTNKNNRISFRLEKLSEANGILHDNAHDALSDVYATIAMAKLIKTKQPRLYDFCLKLRNKHKVLELINLSQAKPFLHVSGMYSSDHGHCAIVLPLIAHPTNSNGIIVYDLRFSIDDLIALDAQEIKKRLYSPNKELQELGLQRIALKTIHINKCPAIAPLNTLSTEAAQRLDIQLDEHLFNAQNLIMKMSNNTILRDKLNTIFETDANHQMPVHDVDQALYSGGFFNRHDREKMDKIIQADEKNIMQLDFSFNDHRLEELFFRYKCRNFNALLTEQERDLWDKYRIKRITHSNENASIFYTEYQQKINQLLNTETHKDKLLVLQKLKEYTQQFDILYEKYY